MLGLSRNKKWGREMESKPKIGRPRAEGEPGTEPVEEAILAAARSLLRAKGYSATSTREIATAAGLRQPTLFHYFKNKATMMDAIAKSAIEPEIEFLASEAKQDWPPDVGLYRYVWFIVFNLHTNPNVIGSPHRFPELTREDFGDFWQQYDHVRHTLRDLIVAGIRQGIFIEVNSKIASEQLFALIEYTLNADSTPSAVPEASASQAADTAAALVLRALLTDANRLDQIAAAAR